MWCISTNLASITIAISNGASSIMPLKFYSMLAPRPENNSKLYVTTSTHQKVKDKYKIY